MLLTDDMRDLLRIFDEYNVRYVLVGGFAVSYHGYVRTTQDLDVLVYPSNENARRVMEALTAFGFGGAGIPSTLFEREKAVVHLGVEPNRIDLITSILGVSNDQLFENLVVVKQQGISMRLISRADLITSKQASTRLQDLADAEELKKLDR